MRERLQQKWKRKKWKTTGEKKWKKLKREREIFFKCKGSFDDCRCTGPRQRSIPEPEAWCWSQELRWGLYYGSLHLVLWLASESFLDVSMSNNLVGVAPDQLFTHCQQPCGLYCPRWIPHSRLHKNQIKWLLQVTQQEWVCKLKSMFFLVLLLFFLLTDHPNLEHLTNVSRTRRNSHSGTIQAGAQQTSV